MQIRVLSAQKVEICMPRVQGKHCIRVQITRMWLTQALEVQFADSQTYSYPAELLRAESLAANSRKAHRVRACHRVTLGKRTEREVRIYRSPTTCMHG